MKYKLQIQYFASAPTITQIKNGDTTYDIFDKRLSTSVISIENSGKLLAIGPAGNVIASDDTGLITAIQMNNTLYEVPVGENGIVDLGTVLTEHQTLTDLGITLTAAEINNTQEKLVSTANIKTINGQSILGAGDIEIITNPNPAWGDIIGDLINQSDLQNVLDTYVSQNERGVANGVAELDENGFVPSTQLPSYVDDIIEYPATTSFPATGESNKIYLSIEQNATYRWSGSQYVLVGDGSLTLGETEATAYRGDRGKAAYDHANTTGNPHNTTKANIGLEFVENKSSAMIRNEITVANVPELPATKITSGTLNVARIPNLDASKIISGALPDARIASATTWNAKPDNLADLGVSTTVTELNKLHGLTVTANELNYLADVTGSVQEQLNGKLTNDATLLRQRNVVDNLTSTSAIYPLSAAQGKLLNETKQNNLTAGTNINITNDVISAVFPVSTAKIDLLWGGVSTWLAATTLLLSHPYTDYDLICFIFSNSGESAYAAIASSYVDSKIYPVSFLKDIQDAGTGAIALFGYSTRYVKYQITDATTFTWIRNGDSGTTGVIAVYGIKLNK